MRISTITNIDINFASVILGYKVTQSNRLNFVSSCCIHATYQMLRNNVKYDLSEWMRSELMLNLVKIKGIKRGNFRYGNLIVCLMLYFWNELPGLGKKHWAHDISVGMQIKEAITSLGTSRDEKLLGYFKTFQENMRQRERISKNIVQKYSTDICFMVKTDETLMEAVEPKKI